MKRILQKIAVLGLVLGSALTASAAIKLPRLIGNDMILQQKIKNTLWGWVDPGATVNVKASWGASATVTADKDGKWKALLETPGHSTGHSLAISSGKDKVDITNVAIGEVWLCVGQSNMGFGLDGTFTGKEDLMGLDLPNFRMFRGVREIADEPRELSLDLVVRWRPMNEDYAAVCSAVSFYFAHRLHQDLNVPVGIIIKASAGTPVEAWMPKELQLDDPRTMANIKANDEVTAKRFPEEKIKEDIERYNKDLEEYRAKVASGITTRKPTTVKPLEPPHRNIPRSFSAQYPGTLYNAMIHPMRHYGIRGVLWYQGERNSKSAQQASNFYRQLKLLVHTYRSIWSDGTDGQVDKEFPFLVTQLPSWHAPQQKPDEGVGASWTVTRNVMRIASQELTNVGLAVSIDTGSENSLHPKNKKPIGIRHAYWALKNVYDKDLVDSGPRYKEVSFKGKKAVLSFDSLGSGLMAAKPGDLNSFVLAGKDKQWHWATGRIVGDTVEVTSSDVSEPVALRYAWAMNPSQRNLLYNKDGIPASPFRTDDWALFDPSAEEVEVFKPHPPKGYVATDWERPTMTQ